MMRFLRVFFPILLLIYELKVVLAFTTSYISIPSTSHHHSKKGKTRCFIRLAAAAKKENVVVSRIESTPNPLSFIIHLQESMPGLENLSGTLRGKTYSSSKLQYGKSAPPDLIASILEIDGIDSVFAMANVITINKKSKVAWETVLPLVLRSMHGDNEKAQKQHEILLQNFLSEKSSSSTQGQIRIRIQTSNKIPIQIEGVGYLGTVQRLKLAPKFQEAMEELERQNPDIDFFTNRIWTDRGVRYLVDEEEEEGNSYESNGEESISKRNKSFLKKFSTKEEKERYELEAVLQAEAKDIDNAYPPGRLTRIIAENCWGVKENSQAQQQKKEVQIQATELPDLEAVDRYCDLAETGDLEALKILVNFVKGHEGLLPARRNALAYLGGTAGNDNYETVKNMVFFAVSSSLQNEKSPMMRRTAGDALSDLGDDRAVPYAMTALEKDRSKLVQWRAARILGELANSSDVVAFLKELSFKSNYVFEVAFEIKDALRKVRARVQSTNDNLPNTGPMWRQIQEGTFSSNASKTTTGDK